MLLPVPPARRPTCRPRRSTAISTGSTRPASPSPPWPNVPAMPRIPARCSTPPAPSTNGKGPSRVNIEEVKALGDAIRAEVGKAVVGLDEAVELMLVALFASGHILL